MCNNATIMRAELPCRHVLTFQQEAIWPAYQSTIEMDPRLLLWCSTAQKMWKHVGFDIYWASYNATSYAEVWTMLVFHKNHFPLEFLEQVAIMWW